MKANHQAMDARDCPTPVGQHLSDGIRQGPTSRADGHCPPCDPHEAAASSWLIPVTAGNLRGGKTIAVIGLNRSGKTTVACHIVWCLAAHLSSGQLVGLDLGSARNLKQRHDERHFDVPLCVQHGPRQHHRLDADALYVVDGGSEELPERLARANVQVIVLGDMNANHEVQKLATDLKRAGATSDVDIKCATHGSPMRIVVWCERRGSRREEPRPTWHELAEWFDVPLERAIEVPYCAGFPIRQNLGLSIWHDTDEPESVDALRAARIAMLRIVSEALTAAVDGSTPHLRLHHELPGDAAIQKLVDAPERTPTVRIPPPPREGERGSHRDPYKLTPRIEKRVAVEDLPEEQKKRLPKRAVRWDELGLEAGPDPTKIRVTKSVRAVLLQLNRTRGFSYTQSVRTFLLAAADYVQHCRPRQFNVTVSEPRLRMISVRIDDELRNAIDRIRRHAPDATDATVINWAVMAMNSLHGSPLRRAKDAQATLPPDYATYNPRGR